MGQVSNAVFEALVGIYTSPLLYIYPPPKRYPVAEIIRIPRVSAHDHKLKAIDIFVQVGDRVELHDSLAAFEGQSMTFELEAHFEGRIIYSTLWPGRRYEIGDVILIIGEDHEDPQKILEEEASASMAGQAAVAQGSIHVQGMEFEVEDLLDLRFGLVQLLDMSRDTPTAEILHRIKQLVP